MQNVRPPRCLAALALFILAWIPLARAITDTYNSSTTWTVPAGVTSVTIEAWGGGGNGAGGLTHGGGGGGGAYAKSTLSTNPGTAYTINVGPAALGSFVRIGNGSDLVRAAAGSSATSALGGLGGQTSSSVGSVLYAGGRGADGKNDGTFGSQFGGGGGGSAFTNGPGNYTSLAVSTSGGSGTGPGGTGGQNGPGTQGQSPGGGGGGSADNVSGSSGAAGRVRITYVVQLPEIGLIGNSNPISSGDTTPSPADHTDFGSVAVSGGTVTRVFTISNTGSGVLNLTGNPLVIVSGSSDFTVTQPASQSINPGASITFAVAFDPSAAGLRSANLILFNTDSDEGSYSFAVQGTGIAPEIAVEQAGLDRPAGATVDFGGVALGESADVVFTVRNSGAVELVLTGSPPVVVLGTPGGFDITAQPSTPVAVSGGTTTFSVRFAPTTAGARSIGIRIANTDENEASFTLTLTGTGLSSANDTDGDGLNDVAELKLAPLGFDWQSFQASLVSTYFTHAPEAGLYTAAQLQSLHPGTPLIARDPATGRFRLTLDWQRTTDLSAAFGDFPAPPASTVTIAPSGDVIFEFPDPSPTVFYRLQVE
jgi:hypothetical protein